MQRSAKTIALPEDLASVFGEMEKGTCIEPSDEEFERMVNERALKHSAE